MVAWWSTADGGDRVVVLGLVHSLVQLTAAGALLVLLARRLPDRRLPDRLGLVRPLLRTIAASGVAGAAAWGATRVVDLDGRGGAAVAVALAGVVGVVVYAVLQRGAWPERPGSG
jgi:hypothetical protein